MFSHLRPITLRLLGLFLSTIACSPVAHGIETRSGEKVHIKADEVIEGDLYAFGEKVIVEGTIKGDLIAFGKEIVVKGSVEGDVAAAGQSVLIEGQIGDDARLAGQVIKLASKSHVKGDVVAAGQSFELEDEAQISGDAALAGAQADLSGDIAGKLKAGVANCRIAGTITGDINLEVGGHDGPMPSFGPPPAVGMPTVPAGLTIDSTAILKGKLVYTGPREAKIDDEAELASEAVFNQEVDEPKPAPTAVERALPYLRHVVTVALLGLVMVLLLPRWSAGWSETLRTRPLLSIVGGIGLIALFIVALIALLIGVVLLAMLLGALTLEEMAVVVAVLGMLSGIGLTGGFWLVTVYLATAIAGLTIGRLIIPSARGLDTVLPFVIGFALLAAVSSIPYVGVVIAWAAMLGGLGALGLWWVQPRQPESLPIPAQLVPAPM